MPQKPFKDSLAQGIFQTNNPLNQNTPNSMIEPYQRRNFGSSNVPYLGQEGIADDDVYDPNLDWGGEGLPFEQYGPEIYTGGSGGGTVTPEPDIEEQNWLQAEDWAQLILNQNEGQFGMYLGEGFSNQDLENFLFDWMQGNVEGVAWDPNPPYGTAGGDLTEMVNWLTQQGIVTTEAPAEQDTGGGGGGGYSLDIPPNYSGGDYLQTEGIPGKPEGAGGAYTPSSGARRLGTPFGMEGLGKRSGFASRGSFMEGFLKDKEKET